VAEHVDGHRQTDRHDQAHRDHRAREASARHGEDAMGCEGAPEEERPGFQLAREEHREAVDEHHLGDGGAAEGGQALRPARDEGQPHGEEKALHRFHRPVLDHEPGGEGSALR
jgi:hypothetical protein